MAGKMVARGLWVIAPLLPYSECARAWATRETEMSPPADSEILCRTQTELYAFLRLRHELVWRIVAGASLILLALLAAQSWLREGAGETVIAKALLSVFAVLVGVLATAWLRSSRRVYNDQAQRVVRIQVLLGLFADQEDGEPTFPPKWRCWGIEQSWLERLRKGENVLMAQSLVCVLTLCIALVPWLPLPSKASSADVIRAQRFELVDEAGSMRAALFVDDIGSGLLLYDELGEVGARLGMLAESPGLVLFDRRGGPRAELVVLPNGNPSLHLYDERGKAQTVLAVVTDGNSGVVLADKRGKVIWEAP